MKIQWLGHCSFLITSDSGLRIITDPYENQMSLRWNDLDEKADVVTVSHEHFDHNNVSAIRGNPVIVRDTIEVKGIKFNMIPTFHGSGMGNNRVFCFKVDGVNICHCGDLGHMFSDDQAKAMGKVDVLFVPIGGTYTTDAEIATKIYEKLKPGIVIPMHFSCEKMTSDIIKGIDGFIKGKDNVIRLDSSEINLEAGALPTTTQIILPKSVN